MRKLEESLRKQKKQTRQEVQQLPGILGIPIGGQKRVEVANRNSYVYVRLRNNQSEVIQAFNNKVSASYNLPVLVERQGNRYVVVSVDTQRYDNNWSSFSPFLARHGNSHSFSPESGGGGDVVWVNTRQFMPLLAVPSGSVGGPNVVVSPYVLKTPSASWMYVGNTGTQNLTPYKPANNQAVMALVYIDSVSGNPQFLVGSGSYFSASITGTPGVLPYIPTSTNPDWIPIMAVRLVSGTNAIGWDNMYDVRQFLHNTPTGSGGGSSPGSSFDNFWTSGTNGAYNIRQKSDSQPTVIGNYSVGIGISHYISGSNSFAEGGSHTVIGGENHAEGSSNTVQGNSNHAEGAINHVVGDNNHIEGGSNHIYGDTSHAEGNENTISGSYAFVSGFANENLANYSMILGGSGSKLTQAALGSVMIGVNNYTGTEPNTEYVNKLNVRRLHNASSVANVGISSLGFLVTGTTGGGSTLANEIVSISGTFGTAAVNTRYFANLSTLTGNRNFAIPSGTTGDVIELYITSGHSDSALIIVGATSAIAINGISGGVEWSRVFITGEQIKLFCISSANWQVVDDGRIPCVGKLTRTGSDANTTHAAATLIRPDWNTAEVNNAGSFVSTTNDEITVRRAGNYEVVGSYAPAAAVADQDYMVIQIHKNPAGTPAFGTSVAAGGLRQSAAGSSSLTLSGALSSVVTCAVGDDLVYFFYTETSNRGLNRTDSNDANQGQSFFQVKEIL